MRPAAAPAFALVLSFVSASVLAAPCAGFNDVDDSDPFCVSVEWMKNRGITAGVTPTTYEPNSPVTRLQMAAFMYRLGFQNALLQGGNAFGAKARFGTTDAESVEIISGAQRVAFFERRLAPNVILGTAHPDIPQLGGYDGITIGGGHVNTATQGWATIGGGNANRAGAAATVPGGFENHAIGNHSFAAGRKAKANHDYCFVWGAGTSDTSCFAPNEVVMNGMGGFYFWTSGSNDNTYAGARLAPGSGAWAVYSDVNGKEALEPVDARDVLARLVAMPVLRWQWKAEAGGVKHMGPTAQAFRSAFGLGDSDRQIVTIDADGVALAAIQGLNAKLEERIAARDAELAEQRVHLAQQRARIDALVQRLQAVEMRIGGGSANALTPATFDHDRRAGALPALR